MQYIDHNIQFDIDAFRRRVEGTYNEVCGHIPQYKKDDLTKSIRTLEREREYLKKFEKYGFHPDNIDDSYPVNMEVPLAECHQVIAASKHFYGIRDISGITSARCIDGYATIIRSSDCVSQGIHVAHSITYTASVCTYTTNKNIITDDDLKGHVQVITYCRSDLKSIYLKCKESPAMKAIQKRVTLVSDTMLIGAMDI